jgi:hypothetical protein
VRNNDHATQMAFIVALFPELDSFYRNNASKRGKEEKSLRFKLTGYFEWVSWIILK